MKRVIDSWVLARSDRAGSWRVFLEALKSDLADIQGGITRRGYPPRRHGRTVDLVQRGYTGIVTRGDTVWLNPRLPDGLACLRLTIRYRGLALDLEVTRAALEVHARALQRRADRSRRRRRGAHAQGGRGPALRAVSGYSAPGKRNTSMPGCLASLATVVAMARFSSLNNASTW